MTAVDFDADCTERLWTTASQAATRWKELWPCCAWWQQQEWSTVPDSTRWRFVFPVCGLLNAFVSTCEWRASPMSFGRSSPSRTPPGVGPFATSHSLQKTMCPVQVMLCLTSGVLLVLSVVVLERRRSADPAGRQSALSRSTGKHRRSSRNAEGQIVYTESSLA